MTVEHTPELHEERIQYQLQLQATQVQNVLGRNGSPASIIGGMVNGRAFHFDLRTHVNGAVHKLRSLKKDIKQALGVESVRFTNEEGGLQLQVLRPFEPAVPLLDLLALTREAAAETAVLGLTADGQPLTHDFTSEHAPNVLISGQEEAGKTVLLRTIAASLALTSRQSQVQLLAINPVTTDQQRKETQGEALRPVSYLPHMLTDVAERQTEINELLQFLVREMDYRVEHEFTSPRIVVLIDQAATVLEHGGRTIRQAVQKLAQRGPEVGINLVLSTRRPESKVFGPHLLTNLQGRYIGKLALNMATEEEAKPAEVEATTLLGEGDFLAVNGNGGLRFQAAYIDNYDLHMTLSNLYEQRPILLAQPLDQRVRLEPSETKKSIDEKQYTFLDELISIE